MKKAWILVAVWALVAGCNFDEGQCWTPGAMAGDGVGGGPILPPQGGYGIEPDPSPQTTTTRWTCVGRVSQCVSPFVQGVWSCPSITSIESTEADARTGALAKCEYEQEVEHWTDTSQDPPAFSCTDTSAMTCTESVTQTFSCTGWAWCKFGSRCEEKDEEWFQACYWNAEKVEDLTAYDARQQLLTQCEEQVEGEEGKDVFCMPGKPGQGGQPGKLTLTCK